MHRIIKPGSFFSTGEVFVIPDDAPEQEPEEDNSIDNAQIEEAEAQSSYMSMQEEKIMEKANDISQRILQSAGAEREQILQQAKADAQRIRQDARNEGYLDAITQKEKEIVSCISEVENLMDSLQEDHRIFLEQYERGLNNLAIEIANKVLKEAIQENGEFMISLVKDAVSSVRNASWISIQVSERLPSLVENLKRELSDAQSLRYAVEVSGIDAPEDTCIIQTPEGVLDASVSVQMENVKNMLERP